MSRTFFLFFYTLLTVLIFPVLFPSLRLIFFAPFLITIFYDKQIIPTLWLALLCGLIIDLLSSQTRLGIYALNYSLTSAILYHQKRHLFEDSVITVPIMTFFFAVLSTLIQSFLLYVFGKGILISWEWIKSDLMWMPFQDALYAGIAFTLPTLFFPKTSRRRTVLFSPKGRLS